VILILKTLSLKEEKNFRGEVGDREVAKSKQVPENLLKLTTLPTGGRMNGV